jgi:uncharacterized protein
MNALKFIACNFIWISFLGLVMVLTKNSPATETGLSIIGILYMPSPLVFTLIFERFKWREIVDKYGLSFRKWQVRKTILWSILFYVLFTALYLGLTFILGNWLKISGIGHVMLDRQEFLSLTGEVKLPLGDNLSLLYLISFLNSIFVGLIINTFFAFGEELGWRGYLWQQLNQSDSLSSFQSKLILGITWGLWHAPLILQGYNFPGQPILGVVYMLLSTVPLTFILVSATAKYKTVMVAAFAHGLINATAYLSVVIPDGQSPLGTILGLVSITSMVAAWKIVNGVMNKA